MESRYKRELNHNYLIIAMEEEDSNYQLKMLLNNQIEGLLDVWMKQVDGKREFYYEISSKQPFSRLLDRKRLSSEELKGFILSLTAVLKRVEEYLLPVKQLVLDPDYIYVEPETFRFFFCCLPGYEDGGPGAALELMKYLLDRVDYQEQEAVSLIYRLYQEAIKDNFKIETLAELLYKKDGAKKQEEREEKECMLPPEKELPQQEEKDASIGSAPEANKLLLSICVASSFIVALCALFWPAVVWKGNLWPMLRINWPLVLIAELAIVGAFAWLIRCLIKEWSQGSHDWGDLWENDGKRTDGEEWNIQMKGEFKEEKGAEIEETDEMEELEEEGDGILQWIGETVVLSKAEEQGTARRLVPLDEGEETIIRQFPFVIGKSPKLADLVLPYTAVSRMHARIDRQPDGYRITDLNSTNGTRVGEHRLEANESAVLLVGEEFWIANVGFRFE